jgi:hypothetical protein
VDRDAVEARARDAAPQPPELPCAADGSHAADAFDAVERLEQRPASRADRHHASCAQKWPDRFEGALGQAAVPALQVEHKLRFGSDRPQQVSEEESRSERACELPAVPENRHPADRLQVAHLDPPSEEVQVCLDHADAERLR